MRTFSHELSQSFTRRVYAIERHLLSGFEDANHVETAGQSRIGDRWVERDRGRHRQAPEAMEGHPVKPLAAYGSHVTLEGPEVEGVVIAEFPTVEAARTWYDSPAYQEAAQHRFRGAVYRGLIVEGV